MTKQWEENQESKISSTVCGEFPTTESMRTVCNPCEFQSPKAYKEVETDQESVESSDDTESPRSVAKIADWRKKLVYVHYQIRRIREEDSHLGEDIGEGINAKEKINSIGDWCDIGHHNPHSHPYHNRVNPQMNVYIISRPILPSSPLSRKNTITI